jgi:cholest-4-en-3-one 26-monooxygenase
MTAPSVADIDLNDPEMFIEARFHEAMRQIRLNDPVHWNPGSEVANGYWSITKYEDVMYISRNPELFISSKGIAGPGIRPERLAEVMASDPAAATQANGGNASIITMDPPRHVKMRRLVNKGFTPRAVNAMEDEIRRMTNTILDGIAKKGECDFVLEVASQLPLAVICGMMGIEQKDWPLMFDLTNRVLGSGDPEYQTDVPEDKRGTGEAARMTAMGGVFQMMQFFSAALEDRRQNPRENDLITILLESEIEGEKLTEGDLLAFCFLLIVAGNETTRNAISGGLQVLSENPEQKAKLLANPDLLDSTIEEILRWVSPVHHMARTVTADVEIRGKTLKEGDRLIMWYGSVNRDEDIFPDPYTFDITRSPNDHLAFGIGEHFCLGAGFARKELRVMFQELFRRFPDIEMSGPPERLRSNFINGIKHLPVRFTPEANG